MKEEFFKAIGDMRFIDMIDLYQRREKIREKYLKLSLDFKEMYKWYFFFELCIMNNGLKSAMWTYLNDESNSTSVNLDLHVEYSKYLRKRERLKRVRTFDEEVTESELKRIEEEEEKRIRAML